MRGTSLLLLQTYLGLAWTLGCFIFGALVAGESKECRMSKQYLCQASLLLTGVAVMAFTGVEGQNGYTIFAWTYGLFYGGYSYSLKLYIYEKVRARNFARAWGFAQFSMAIPNAIGVPIAGYLTNNYGRPSGSYLSAISILCGGLLMTLIDVHKWNLRKRHARHRSQYLSKKSVSQNGHLSVAIDPSAPPSQADPVSSVHSIAAHNSEILPDGNSHRSGIATPSASSASVSEKVLERKMSFTDQDDFLPPISLLSHQRSFVYDDLIDELKNVSGKPELSIFSEEEGIADMDLPDHLFIDDLEFLDNITSCAKVENCVELSEYEQNLIKETESPTPGRRKKKWSLFKQQQQQQLGGSPVSAAGAAGRPMIGVGGLRQSSFLVADNNAALAAGGRGKKHRGNNAESNNNGSNGGGGGGGGGGAVARELPVFAAAAAAAASSGRRQQQQQQQQQVPGASASSSANATAAVAAATGASPKRSFTVIEESV